VLDHPWQGPSPDYIDLQNRSFRIDRLSWHGLSPTGFSPLLNGRKARFSGLGILVFELQAIHGEVYSVLKNCKVVPSGSCEKDSRSRVLDRERYS
jgi:hypothetical protein